MQFRRPILDTLANLAFVVVCIVFVAFLGQRMMQPAAATPQVPKGYSVGDALPALDGAPYASNERTLILFLSSGCKFCTDSMPFYQKLSAAREGRYQLLVVGAESENALSEYLAKHKVVADRVMRLKPGQMKVFATPTVLVADRQGKTLGQWLGMLGTRESEVSKALGNPPVVESEVTRRSE